jgi:hypothetical protein
MIASVTYLMFYDMCEVHQPAAPVSVLANKACGVKEPVMPLPDCNIAMKIAQDLFESDRGFQEDVTAILESDRSALRIVESFASRLGPTQGAMIRREYESLPDYVWVAIADAWKRSHEAGVALELRNVAPKSVTEFARRRRVELSVIAESDRIIVELAHVPTRHAEWYAPVPVSS